MTMTESPPAEAAESSAAEASPASGLYAALSTSDHKAIGRIWLRLALLLLVASTALGVALAIEDTDPDAVDVFGGANSWFQMWTLHRFGIVLMVAVPLFIGLATIVVPMQVGSTNIAFPRAAAAAAWGYVLGTAITVISVLSGGGWGALDGVDGDEADAIELTLLGTGMIVVSILLASVCLATTVISLRTPGMGLTKVPLFAWSMLVASAVWLLTLPIALANLVLIVVDLRGGPGLFGNPEGSTLIYDQLAWIFEQPAIYAITLPVLGVIGSVVPVVAGARQVSHAAMMTLIGLAGLLAIGGWSQPHFSDHRDGLLFVAFGLVAIVPVLASLGGNTATLLKGGVPAGLPPAHLVGALAGGLLVLLTALVGALRVIDPLDLIGTEADAAVMNLAVFAAITGAVAGMWFWSAKIGGHLLSPSMGPLVVIDFTGAGLLLGISGLLIGLDLGTGLDDAMVWVAVVGAVLALLGSLGVVASIAQAMRSDADVDDDPWNGHTLEWATATPVPAGNFTEPLARVTSESPLLDADDASEAGDEGGES